MNQTRFLNYLGFAATLSIMLLLAFAAWRESDRQAKVREARERTAINRAIDLYAQHCVSCHGAFGEGLNLVPALNNDVLRQQKKDFLVNTISRGRMYTDMAAFAIDEGGGLTTPEIESLVLLVQKAPWNRVNRRVEELGLTPPEDTALIDFENLPYSIETIQEGRQLYLANCVSCHGSGGTAVQGNLIGKPLTDNEFVQQSTDDDLIAFIKQGRAVGNPDNTTGYEMPPYGGNSALTDDAFRKIVAYMHAIGNVAIPEDNTPAEVAYTGNDYQWIQVVDNLDSPLNIVSARDGSGRLFVVEQPGVILVVENGNYRSEPFLDITHQVPVQVYSGSYTEQGVLGLAFHPEYKNNGFFFISYTDVSGDSVIARYQVMPDNAYRADPASGVTLLTLDQPYEDHNGGNIVFGPDGYLYIGFGDGGRPAEPNYNSQIPDSFLGKMLRIDVNAGTYLIPEDNPYVNNPAYAPEIWAVGLRNPWRFTFDRKTGDLYIGDVGQWILEEIDFQPADSPGGENYGWSAYEASQPYLADATLLSAVTMPVLEYSHDSGCSVTGGYVYRGQLLPELEGSYIYGDYCAGRIWQATQDERKEWQTTIFMDTNFVISSFGEDEQGEIYLVDYKGAIYRLEAKPIASPEDN